MTGKPEFEYLTGSLDAILESVGELQVSIGGLSAQVAAGAAETARLRSAIDGGDQHRGIRTEIQLLSARLDQLERAATAAKPETSTAGAIVIPAETAKEWTSTAKSVGPYLVAAASGALAWAAQHFQWIPVVLLLATIAACARAEPPRLSCPPGMNLYAYTSTFGETLTCRPPYSAPPGARLIGDDAQIAIDVALDIVSRSTP